MGVRCLTALLALVAVTLGAATSAHAAPSTRLNVIPDKAQRMAEIAADPVRLLYVSRTSFADVVAIDLRSRRILWRAPVDGYRSDHMAISPDGLRMGRFPGKES